MSYFLHSLKSNIITGSLVGFEKLDENWGTTSTTIANCEKFQAITHSISNYLLKYFQEISENNHEGWGMKWIKIGNSQKKTGI